jgi:archaellum biogenesis protein FlaJ (TadC family)
LNTATLECDIFDDEDESEDVILVIIITTMRFIACFKDPVSRIKELKWELSRLRRSYDYTVKKGEEMQEFLQMETKVVQEMYDESEQERKEVRVKRYLFGRSNH